VQAEYEAYCDTHADEAAVFADASGFRSRLANFHLSSSAALSIGADPGVMALLGFLFGYRAAIYRSLVFERGTQQKVHRDTPYFRTEPPQFFFGVWTALEDVRPDAGPLVYLPGAHSIEIDPYEVAGGVHWLNAQQPDQVPRDPSAVYDETIVRLAADRGIAPTTMAASKGDTLIWRPELPHAGSPITRPTATRARIVFHCVPEGVPVFGPDRFFDADRSPNWDPLRYRFAGDRADLDLGRPSFEPNRD
jgi:ectoine hydroxylase-related dioxygenase (phytanoyl-CoA dioxygenase family)